MILQLTDRNQGMIDAWNYYFKDIPDIEIVKGDALSYQSDVIMCPGNSFGFMDGGFDLNVISKLGEQVERDVQRTIETAFDGEMLVGQCAMLYTGHKRHPFLVYAPTLRVPVMIENTVNVYMAFRAVLRMLTRQVYIDNYHLSADISSEVHSILWNRSNSSAIGSFVIKDICNRMIVTGLGTGVGGMTYMQSAKQMYAAFQEVYMQNIPSLKTLDKYWNHHLNLIGMKKNNDDRI